MFRLMWWCAVMSGCLRQLEACGHAPLNSRIVDGQDTPPGAWPWLASVHVSEVPTCGGSLINSQWVLAAAQCFPRYGICTTQLRSRDTQWVLAATQCYSSVTPNDVVVYLGHQSRSGSNPKEESRTVSQIIVHENYDFFSGENDIALLQLSSSVTFTDHIQPVCLAATGSVLSRGTLTWITGFGNVDGGALYEIQVSVIENCKALYGGAVTDNLMCAGTLTKGRDACEGYIGSPMVVSHGRVWIQAGVSIIGCNQAGGPRVLTRVSLYQDWISTHIIPSSDQPGFIQLGIGPPTSLPQPTTTLSSQAPPTRTSQAPSTPSPSLATTLPLPDRGRSCRFRPLNNIAIPTVWISVIIGPVSNNTDRKLLAKNTLTQLEQVSKRYFKDPEQRIANILQCTQRESVVDLDMQLTFRPVSEPPPLRLCFPGNGLVRAALAETFRGYTHVEIRNITNGLSVIAKFETNIVYEEALSDPTSPQFKNMERRIVRVIDEINRAKYGILYKRTIVLGFRPRSQSRRSKRDVMATEVELQEEFESNSTDTTDTHSIVISSDDVRDTLKKAAGNSTLGFTLDLNTVSIAEASKAVMWYPASFGTISVIGPCLLLPWMWLAF